MKDIIEYGKFEWSQEKEKINVLKHKIDFCSATFAFLDPRRIIAVDELHSEDEPRLFCIGKIGNKIATVRFTLRGDRIRIIGAGFWRKGKSFYEEENK